MLRITIAASLIFGFFVATYAQEFDNNYEHLKVLQPFLGPWVYEGTLQEEVPDLGEKDTPCRIPIEYEWVLDKNALSLSWSIQLKDDGNLNGRALIGWNSKEGQIVAYGFNNVGGMGDDVWVVDGRTLTIKSHEILADGTESTATIYNKLTDRGTMIWQAVDRVRSGEKLEDSPEYEFRPRKPRDVAKAEKTLFDEYAEAHIGRWEGKTTLLNDVPGLGVEGDTITPTYVCRPSLDGNALLGEWTCGDVESRGITMWDPVEEKIRSFWSSSVGIIGRSSVSKQGDKWIVEGTSCWPDGSTQSSIDTITVKNGGNTHQHKVTNTKRDGEPLPDSTAIWKRVKRGKKTQNSQDMTSTCEEFKEFGDLQVGRWNSDITFIADWPGQPKKQGEKVNGYMGVRWILDGCALEEDEHVGATSQKSIYVWDPGLRQIQARRVYSDGGTGTTTYWKEDGRWTWKHEGKMLDGRPLVGTGKLIFKDDGRTQIAEGTLYLDGEKLLPYRDVYHRLTR